MGLEVRPAHDPVRQYGFLGVVVDTTNLEGSIWTWWRDGGKFHIEKTATIPPEPASKDQLPALLQGFGAVPPLFHNKRRKVCPQPKSQRSSPWTATPRWRIRRSSIAPPPPTRGSTVNANFTNLPVALTDFKAGIDSVTALMAQAVDGSKKIIAEEKKQCARLSR